MREGDRPNCQQIFANKENETKAFQELCYMIFLFSRVALELA
jgi:hypothetical protein